ncbi:uncharacterized protein BDW43DRAFT_305969 [Aspergillus alliaceus]|uniref:uncharacterized protein n=1 Tax=Petromyces alliaceus TaxID=209559 RepID=UPI0012A5D974|nr:uncharacterized protein BDW43DRAFT_305969 [Aspergillus alliaceus]KAB8239084.1 hypothetical protein BDW43DRAFT_305969 [Aspergillus alliaceus]
MNYEIKQDLRRDPERYSDNPRPEQLVQESHRDVVVSDKRCWDGAGIEPIRRHFADYLHKTKLGAYGGCGLSEACMVTDERSLKSIIACPKPDSKDRFTRLDGFVGMVDGRYNPEGKDSPRYLGLMRVGIGFLWWLYISFGSRTMEELCPSVPPVFIPVYDGGNGESA